MTQLPPHHRTLAIALLEQGLSMRSVARRLNVSHTSIRKLRHKWETQFTVERSRGSGTKRKTTHEEDIAIVNYVKQNPFSTVRQAIEATGFKGCESTARNRLKALGLINSNPSVKDILSSDDRQRRLKFAKYCLEQEENFWHKVIFSAKRTFHSTKSGNKKEQSLGCDTENVQNERLSVHMWGWISVAGPGVIWRIEDKLTALHYRTILSDIMLPSVSVFHSEFVFQHGNSPINTSSVIQQWVKENKISILAWPTKSSDLNPLENIWNYVMRQLNEVCAGIPQDRNSLWECVEGIWDNIDVTYVQRLILSMPDRLKAVLDCGGGMTEY